MSSRNSNRGMSLIEVLISLAITALLLTAAAAAFSASSQAIEMNDQFARATQSARISVNRIMTEARQCKSGVVGATSLDLTTSDGQKVYYALDATNKELTLTLNSLAVPETHVLARNVSSLHFDTDGKSIAMAVTVTVGTNAVTLNGSALPRRTVTYK